MTPHEQVRNEILSLQTALLSAHPSMPALLQKIHRQLKNDPEVVTLLSEDDIQIIVSGLQKQTQVTLASSMTKTSAAKTKSLAKTTSEDLGF